MKDPDKYLSVYQSRRLRKVISTLDASCFWWRISGTNTYRLSTLKSHETLLDFYKTFGKINIVPTYTVKELLKKLPKKVVYEGITYFLFIRKDNGQVEIEYNYDSTFAPGVIVIEKTLIKAICQLIINYHDFLYHNETKV